VPDEHGGEFGITPGGEDGEAVPRRPEHQPGQPLLEAQPDGRSERTVDDGDSARCAAEQDRAAKRAMDWRFEALDVALPLMR